VTALLKTTAMWKVCHQWRHFTVVFSRAKGSVRLSPASILLVTLGKGEMVRGGLLTLSIHSCVGRAPKGLMDTPAPMWLFLGGEGILARRREVALSLELEPLGEQRRTEWSLCSGVWHFFL
jgi:hypothetical protein